MEIAPFRIHLLLLLVLSLVATLPTAHAAEDHAEAIEVPPEGVASLFHVTARPPRPGEWMEYRIAFPVDPLENSLRSDSAPFPQLNVDDKGFEVVTGLDGEQYIKPSFTQQTAWRVLPLRLEVTAADPLGFVAVLRFEKANKIARFPISRGQAKANFFFDGPQPKDEKISVILDSGQYNALSISRIGENYGFVRWAGEDAPFGLFRFASENVDLVLVGMGAGPAPEFPLPVQTSISPPPGMLYRPKMETPSTPEAEANTDDSSF